MSPSGSFAIFFGDLGRSMRALMSDYRLLALSLFLGVIGYAAQLAPSGKQQLFAWLTLPVGIFYLGYVGTERIWFARLFHGETLDGSGIWSWTWHLFPRYLRLGLIVLILMSPLIVWTLIEAFRVVGDLTAELQRSGRVEELDRQQVAERLNAARFVLIGLVSALVADFMLTFTTPALVFTHTSAWAALKENFRTMKAGLPASLWYVLVPPFAALLTLRLLPPTAVGSAIYIGLAVIGVFLNVLFKGATVAFYLRQHPSNGRQGPTAPEGLTAAGRSATLQRSELSGHHLR